MSMEIVGLRELAKRLGKDHRTLHRHLAPIDKRLNGWVLTRSGARWLVNLTMLRLAERDALKILEGRVDDLEATVSDHSDRLEVVETALHAMPKRSKRSHREPR